MHRGGKGFVAARRAFEDELFESLERARAEGREGAVLVGTVMGLQQLEARHGEDAVDEALGWLTELVAARLPGIEVHRVGGSELAMVFEDGEAAAREVRRRVSTVLANEATWNGTQLGMAIAVGVGSLDGDGDTELLWRTADRAFRLRASVLQRAVDALLVGASGLDAVVMTLLEVSVPAFGVDALQFEIGGRVWTVPSPAPSGPADAERPLVASSRVPVGFVRWWSDHNGGAVPADVEEMLAPSANAIERTLALESSEGRARRDPLTGLLNRDGLAHAVHGIHVPYAVGVVDIDRFKQVNDRYGHEAGDRCLTALADLLSGARGSDIVARWGGEELVIVMPSTTAEGAAVALRRLLDEALRTIHVEGTPLSFSAGVACVEDELSGVLDGIRAADMAMYEAKRQGRGRVVVASVLD